MLADGHGWLGMVRYDLQGCNFYWQRSEILIVGLFLIKCYESETFRQRIIDIIKCVRKVKKHHGLGAKLYDRPRGGRGIKGEKIKKTVHSLLSHDKET